MNSRKIGVNSLQNSCSWQREIFMSLKAIRLGDYPIKLAASRPHVQNPFMVV